MSCCCRWLVWWFFRYHLENRPRSFTASGRRHYHRHRSCSLLLLGLLLLLLLLMRICTVGEGIRKLSTVQTTDVVLMRCDVALRIGKRRSTAAAEVVANAY